MKKFTSFILAAALGMALRLLLTQRLLSLKPMKKNPLRPQQQEKNPPAAAGTAP